VEPIESRETGKYEAVEKSAREEAPGDKRWGKALRIR
jgi:hypothetical protein